MNLTHQTIPIIFVDNDADIATIAATLQTKTAITFDTEFDRFWREYGFKLFLLQIFDGDTCYIIDPLAIKNLQPIWDVFENKYICKVAYACLEDVQLLKINGCYIQNVFDVQVAAKFCNHASNSFAELVADKCQIVVDKTYQRSNWRKRPLEPNQLKYASNDVIWLLAIKDSLLKYDFNQVLQPMLDEENLLCQQALVSEYTVKLSTKQQATFSPYHSGVLLQLFYLRNTVAKAYNVPPASLVPDAYLENFVTDKQTFFNNGFGIGFSKLISNDETAKTAFAQIINGIDEQIPNIAEKRQFNPHFENYDARVKRKDTADDICKAVATVVQAKYGVITGEYLMRGIKRELQIKPYSEIKLRQYQHKIFENTCKQLQLEVSF